jgi:hypothetical protein
MLAPGNCIATAVNQSDSVRISSNDLALAMFPENWVDFTGKPCPVKHVDYRSVLAREILAPVKIIIGEKIIKIGMSDSSLIQTLDTNYRIVEPPIRRTKAENNQYLSDLLCANPNTMHYYFLYEHKDMEGWFKVVEWTCSDRWKIQIYLRSKNESGKFRVYMIRIKLREVAATGIALRSSKSGLIATRRDLPACEWNTGNNILKIDSK